MNETERLIQEVRKSLLEYETTVRSYIETILPNNWEVRNG